jgi:hypothetical protein
MFRAAILACLALLLAACTTLPGPRSYVITPIEIERQIETDLGAMFELLKGLDVRRPEVALMPVSDRLQLTWNVRLPNGQASPRLAVALVVAGRPELNAARSGIVLTQVTLEDVRLTGAPALYGYGLAQLGDKKGAKLPDLPLISLPAEQMTRQQVAYAATGVTVSYAGLRIDIEPR